MTAKLLRLIALISSNSGFNRSRSTTNVCTNLSALVARSSSMSLPMSWSFSASYMALSLALSLASIPGNTIEICLDTQISRFQKQGTVVSKPWTKSISTTLYTSINVTGIKQLSSATHHCLWYIPSSANTHQSTSLGVLASGSIFSRRSHSFFILWCYLCIVFSQIREPHAVRVRLGSLHVAPSHSGSLRVPMSSAWHVFPHWINNAGSQNSR